MSDITICRRLFKIRLQPNAVLTDRHGARYEASEDETREIMLTLGMGAHKRITLCYGELLPGGKVELERGGEVRP